jgi:hypothetical protein
MRGSATVKTTTEEPMFLTRGYRMPKLKPPRI